MPFSYKQILALHADLAETLPLRQMTREGSSIGGFVDAADGLVNPVSHARYLAICGLALLLPESRLHGDPALSEAVRLGTDFLSRVQRPSGCFDLVSTNFDSPPDTAFALGPLCTLLSVARECRSDAADRIASEIEPIVSRAARGVIGGGFHTPNHRWVIAGALARTRGLLPDLPCMEYIDALLAEGIDQNADGEFFERSFAVYHGICDRAFREMARWLGRAELYEPVRRNLAFLSRMLHDDGTVVTATSRRQDRGLRVAPANLADSFFEMGALDGNGEWLAIADLLIARGVTEYSVVHSAWMDPFVDEPRLRSAELARSPVPDRYTETFPHAGLWRHRDRKLSVTAGIHTTSPLSIQFGRVTLRAVKFYGSWYGMGQFEPTVMRRDDDEIVLVDSGKRRHPPGYDLPLGRPVPWEEIEAGVRRRRIEQPALAMELRLRLAGSAIEARFRTSGGLDGIPFQIEFCFESGGEWETASQFQVGAADQAIHLREGAGVLRCGSEAIRISPGRADHAYREMRGLERETGSFRVLMTMFTPVDHAFKIEAGDWRIGDGTFEVRSA